ncbi:Transcription Activator Brg1, partial [Manis pentadactyla]
FLQLPGLGGKAATLWWWYPTVWRERQRDDTPAPLAVPALQWPPLPSLLYIG